MQILLRFLQWTCLTMHLSMMSMRMTQPLKEKLPATRTMRLCDRRKGPHNSVLNVWKYIYPLRVFCGAVGVVQEGRTL